MRAIGQSSSLQIPFIMGLVIAGSIAGSVGATGGNTSHVRTLASCPRATISNASVEEATSAARRLIPHSFSFRNQRGPVRLTPANSFIVGLIYLGGVRPSPGASQLRRVAEAACGARLARVTWAIEIDFTTAATASSGNGIAFLAKTGRGWRIWKAGSASSMGLRW
jgi:hypothetical protein